MKRPSRKPRMTSLNKSRKKVAYHEAGHYVANRIFERAVEEVSIIPDYEAGTAGHVSPEGITPLDEEEAKRILRENAIMWYAGHASVCAFFPSPKRNMTIASAFAHGAESDWELAKGKLGGRGKHNRSWQQKALALVRKHRIGIERLAKELLRYGRMNSDLGDVLIDETATEAEIEMYRALYRGGASQLTEAQKVELYRAFCAKG
jgi:hypothetical protein